MNKKSKKTNDIIKANRNNSILRTWERKSKGNVFKTVYILGSKIMNNSSKEIIKIEL
mgnify:CR=1 FL=1